MRGLLFPNANRCLQCTKLSNNILDRLAAHFVLQTLGGVLQNLAVKENKLSTSFNANSGYGLGEVVHLRLC